MRFNDYKSLPFKMRSNFFSLMITVSGLAVMGRCDRKTSPVTPNAQLILKAERNGLPTHISAVAISPDNQWMAFGTQKGHIFRYTIKNRMITPWSQVFQHDGPVSSLVISRSGNFLLSLGGNSAATWQISKNPRLLHQIAGPQRLTAGTFSPDERTRYFATDQGFVMAWKDGDLAASPLNQFTCEGMAVLPHRRFLPIKERCPYGSYVEPSTGPPACMYPVTHLQVHASRLIRACRTGTLGLLSLTTGQREYSIVGHLSGLLAFDRQRLLLLRQDGELRFYFFNHKKPPTSFARTEPVIVAAENAPWILLGHHRKISLWHMDHTKPLVQTSLPSTPLWIGFLGTFKRFLILFPEGKLLTYQIDIP